MINPLKDRNTLDVDGLERLVNRTIDGGVAGTDEDFNVSNCTCGLNSPSAEVLHFLRIIHRQNQADVFRGSRNMVFVLEPSNVKRFWRPDSEGDSTALIIAGTP